MHVSAKPFEIERLKLFGRRKVWVRSNTAPERAARCPSHTAVRFERDAGLRLDHLLLSPVLAKQLVSSGVDKAVRGKPGASDHAPT